MSWVKKEGYCPMMDKDRKCTIYSDGCMKEFCSYHPYGYIWEDSIKSEKK